VAGILLTGVLVTLAVWVLFPNDLAVYVFPLYVFTILLWYNAYRVSRKKAVNPST